MGKSITIVATCTVFLLIGGAIIAWSVFQRSRLENAKQQTTQEETEQHLKQFTDENFQKEVVEASKHRPILVDFSTDWCIPCKLLDPVLQEVAKELKDAVVIGKVDTDKNVVGFRFAVDKVPTIFIFCDGEVRNAFFGLVPKETIIKALKECGA